MLPNISDIYCIVIEFPGSVWQTVKDFFGSFLRKWWHSHY